MIVRLWDELATLVRAFNEMMHELEANSRERKASHHRGNGLEWRLLAQTHDTAEGQEIDREFFRRSKSERETRDQCREIRRAFGHRRPCLGALEP